MECCTTRLRCGRAWGSSRNTVVRLAPAFMRWSELRKISPQQGSPSLKFLHCMTSGDLVGFTCPRCRLHAHVDCWILARLPVHISGTAVPVVVSLMTPKDVGFPRPAIGLPGDSFRHGEAY